MAAERKSWRVACPKCLLLCLLILLLGITGIFLSRTPPQTAQSLAEKYALAVKDAEVAEESEIFRNLTPIVSASVSASSNDRKLSWTDDGTRVLVVTWTSWDGYREGERSNVSREIWVTAVPELKNTFTDSQGPDASTNSLTLRLEQLLGLPQNASKKWFVELWVEPSDLFRPCPDPEITDRECGLEFPRNVSNEYASWFNSLRNVSYQGENPYPWTRLGYTYVWGNPESEVGLSEFVIKSGAEVSVAGVYPTEEYFVSNV